MIEAVLIVREKEKCNGLQFLVCLIYIYIFYDLWNSLFLITIADKVTIKKKVKMIHDGMRTRKFEREILTSVSYQ
jgi:hypothetical protein